MSIQRRIYAGIGNNNIPDHIAELIEGTGEFYATRGYTLRIPDTTQTCVSFQIGYMIAKWDYGNIEFYLPGTYIPRWARELVEKTIDTEKLKQSHLDISKQASLDRLARYCMAIFGEYGDEPVDWIITYHDKEDVILYITMCIAHNNGIIVNDLARYWEEKQAREFLCKRLKGSEVQELPQ